MDIGFETIGNATLICHDDGPVLVTDPWLIGGAYFGSWTLSHDIPEQQMEAILGARYVWLSHGHPDHLSSESLALLKDKHILLPNHFGDRIREDLTSHGFQVEVMVDREWKSLSPRMRVMCIPDMNQDAVLLVELDGRLLVNLNDAADHGWGRFVRNIIRQYDCAFLFALSGYGDADMINFFDEDGTRIPPAAARRYPVGRSITHQAEQYGVKYFVPFSSMHKYQRADSIWASEYTTTLADYPRGFESRTCELLPAFIRYDLAHDRLERIDPPEHLVQPIDPAEFGDNWGEQLEREEVRAVDAYFRSIRHLETVLDFIRLRVGGKEHLVAFHSNRHGRGITFEVPRASLMSAVRYEVFDDLLIGNFMKTTLHGDWGRRLLYPDFSPYVAKYADNGRAREKHELRGYFAEYRRRDLLGFLRYRLEASCVRPLQEQSIEVLQAVLPTDSRAYRAARDTWCTLRRALR
jgi:hypothetical protein